MSDQLDGAAGALGPPVGAYRNGMRWALYGLGGGALFVVGSVTALTGVVDRSASSPLAEIVSQILPNGSSVAALILVGLAIALGGVFYLWRFIAAAGQRVALYEEGFSARLRGQNMTVTWGDVAAVRHEIRHFRVLGAPLTSSHTYWLTLKNGERLTLEDTIGGLKSLGALMEERIATVQAPVALATIRGGGSVTFGPWRLDAAGVSKGDAALPWSEVEGVVVDDTVINITQRGRFIPWSWRFVAATPNVATLLMLADDLRANPTPPSSPFA